MKQKQVILTGIRANDEPHLGNYLGGMLPMVELQKNLGSEYQLNIFIPDLHSFTTPIDHSKLSENILKNLKYFVAAGVNINQGNIFVYRQSYIPAHSELTWILNCFTYVGEMNRMTQFKEKSEGSDNVSVGLFDYPVLMAADMLLYNASWVPVGEDQTQHLEIARDIAERFNHKFAGVFPEGVFKVPHETKKQLEFARRDRGVRIRSLSNPEKKMSKSIKDPKGTIMLSDNPETAAKKVMSAMTDSVGKINYDWENQPGISNLLQILTLLSGENQQELNDTWADRESYGELKKAVAVEVKSFLKNFQDRYENINDEELIRTVEAHEKEIARTAEKTLLRAQQAVGLRPRPELA
jgi:tryptophanyl-tRNA synthetase